MTNWKEYKLGEIANDVSYGYTESANEKPIGPKFLRITDIREGSINWDTVPYCPINEKDYVKNKLEIGDIVVARTGATTGITETIKHNVDAVFASYLIRFRINKEVANPFYVGYVLKSIFWKEYVSSIVTGSAQPGANAKQFSNFTFNLPDLPTQTAIAEILSSLDDKIELNNKLNQELENLAQTLFKQWFIDFEFPNENGEPYKSSGGEMVESELGEIPKGWEVRSLDEIADYLNGLALQKFPAQEGENYLPVIKIRELRQGITQASDKASTEVPDKYIIKNGDVLFAWSGSLMIDFWTNGEGALNQHLFKVTSENYPKWFYFYWTKYHLDEFIKIAESKATTMGHIQRKHLTEAKVTVPNSNHLNQFNDNFENLVEAIISNREENQELTNLRDTLLPKLISGELEVTEVMAEKA